MALTLQLKRVLGPKRQGTCLGNRAPTSGSAGAGREWRKPARYRSDDEEEGGRTRPTKCTVDILDNNEEPELNNDLQELLNRARRLMARHGKDWVNQQMQGVLQLDSTTSQKGAAGGDSERGRKNQQWGVTSRRHEAGIESPVVKPKKDSSA
ncbi:hypothetical protein NDU88_002302 [Pleurodeles waltl]|uniref:Uncharacterized protein n=1 Tax=Pleurodeles waltl TaxID=8319 RepID=A0AAV7UWV6_PLEWA|nr:hypothetical protein NDU88_002302 [Pleurodeles waltl]